MSRPHFISKALRPLTMRRFVLSSHVRCSLSTYRLVTVTLAALTSLHGVQAAGVSSLSSALAEIQQRAIPLVARQHPLPIQTVLKHYTVSGMTTFRPAPSTSGDEAGRPPAHRPPGVTRDEWRAFRRSGITLGDAENGSGAFTLLDLDEDGRRDLIVDTYVGGTGLYTYVSVYRRIGNTFRSTPVATGKSSSEEQFLYSINGRGSDQAGQWVRIGGRVYLAYRQGRYGEDVVVLERAFEPIGKRVPALRVEYRYEHQLPRRQSDQQDGGKKSFLIEPKLHKALQRALDRVSALPAQGADDRFGQCPTPEEAEESGWPWFSPPHYSVEAVADIPVRVDGDCYAARIISFKSSYWSAPHYMGTALWLLHKPFGEDEQQEFNLETRRFSKRIQRISLDASEIGAVD